MNYLFYVGIILPTLITICLFLIFIYCWFLQKARKEVLTRRYDPHGKMRRLGMSMDPPPPPDFCRLEATATTPLASHLSPAHYGEDNMAYCVSRSPSTDQQNQQQQQQQQHGNGQPARRSLYHTYHDSGISAGGLAALTESGNIGDGSGEIRPDGGRAGPGGLAYRTCPDSGVSGLSGGFFMLGDGVTCPQPACYLHDHHQHIYSEEQYHQQQHHQQQRPSLQQQQQQLRPQHLHHTLVEASVHPTHGVCYGDNTNHPQSPQHYAPPPHHPQHQEQRYNPHHNPIPQQNDNRLGSLQQLQLAAQIHYPSASTSHKERSGLPYSRRGEMGDDQVFELVSPSAQRPKDALGQEFTTETSFGPQGALDIMVTSSSDPRIANMSLPAQQGIVLSCLVQQQQHHDQQMQMQNSDSVPAAHHNHYPPQQHKQHNMTSSTSTPPTKPKPTVPPGSSMSRLKHHRDSGITDDVAGASGGSNSSTDQSGGIGSSSSNNNTINSSTSSSERPDSQASHSPSTTDSEDSGFRGSHCVNPPHPPQAPVPTSRLNKQSNPLLKPMRRPRNKGSRKNLATHGSSPPRTAKGHASNSNSSVQREPSTVANTDSSNPGSPTPLITLDPQNLSPPALMDSQSLGRGLEMIDMAGRGGPAPLRTPDSSPHHSPHEWSGERSSSRKSSKDGGLDPGGGVDPGDISTHLSWSYLHGLSSSQVGVARPEGGANHLRQDIRHMDALGYSVV